MDTFYSQYRRDFAPDPAASLFANFDALALCRNWAPGGRARTRARRHLQNAMIEEFNTTYGTDAGDLASWQNLCRVVGVAPAPASITQCKKVGFCVCVRERGIDDGLTCAGGRRSERPM